MHVKHALKGLSIDLDVDGRKAAPRVVVDKPWDFPAAAIAVAAATPGFCHSINPFTAL